MYLGTVFGKCTKGATTLHANTLAAKWVPVRRVAGWQPVSLTLERMQECNVVSDMSSFLPTLSLRWRTFGFPQEGRIQLLCSSIHILHRRYIVQRQQKCGVPNTTRVCDNLFVI
jgi:hypothetical protein